MRPPEGFTHNGKVWKLKKSLYGLKQSGRLWNDQISRFLVKHKFKRSMSDHCLYTIQDGANSAFIIIWVDDLLIGATNEAMMKRIKRILSENYKVKDLGQVL